MEVGMSLNALVRLPMSNISRTSEEGLTKHSSLFSSLSTTPRKPARHGQRQRMLVVKAKGKKGMMNRQFQPRTPPPLPKLEDDGNPKFVLFICSAKVGLWYPLSIISGGTTAKIMVAAKDNFLGKYIYKDTIARNLAAVIYRDEKEIQKTALKQHSSLRSATEFRYGYKLVENNNLRAALASSDVIELPTKDKLKTVLDKVKDFFGDAKESFGKLTALNLTTTEELEEKPKEQSKVKG
ncbi:protein HHL1, chloroplastic isoform X1 [Rhododendron vialii]|nr:protein HHL1, chloroplastic isoform X1 [Rhododendron vialii]